MSASAKFFLTKEKKEKKKKWVATARWQHNALQEFLTQKKKTHDCFREWDWEGVEEEFCED